MFAYSCRVGGRVAAAGGVSMVAYSSETASSKVCSRAATKTSQYAIDRLMMMQRQQHRVMMQCCSGQPNQQLRTVWTTVTAKMTQNTTSSLPRASFSTNSSSSSSLMEWYEGHLESRPVLTKMVTGLFLWSIGDAVAQVVPAVTGQSHKPLEYDWPRTGRAALFGFALHAPTSHLHFNFLEWLTHKCGVTGLSIPFFKAFMEQFVYWSWISNSMYHAAMGAMQGLDAHQIYNRIADVLWDTQKAQWVFWIPVQLLNFQFVPVRHQLNVVLLTSIVWTALLSAWYPPLDEEQEEVLEKERPKGGVEEVTLRQRKSLQNQTEAKASHSVKPE